MRLITLRLLLCFFALCFCGCEEGAGVDPRERAELQKIFDEARKLDELGRYHEALVRYETILARRPEYISTRLNAAMAAYDSGQYQKANDHFEILHKLGPGDWFVIRKLIQCNERLGKSEVVETYRKKLEALRQQKDGSLVLKRYEGLTRDFIPIGSMRLIGYEFFEPKKHGRLWHFKLEDRNKKSVSVFLAQATPYHDNSGKRLFSLIEVSFGWMRVWHVGAEIRDYKWSRDFVLECLHGKRSPLVIRPLPHEYEALAMPPLASSESNSKDSTEKQSDAEDTEP